MIKIYGLEGCQPCKQAKSLCEEKGVEYEYFSVGTDVTPQHFTTITGGARSVPQIFINDEHVGGLEKLQEALCNS